MSIAHKARHPSRWDPIRKPSCAVTVDWSEPITRDLVVCMPLIHGAPDNLALGRPSAYGQGVYAGSAQRGVGWGGAACVMTAGDATADLGVKITGTTHNDAGFSVFVMADLPSAGYFASETGSSGNWNISAQSSTSIRMEYTYTGGFTAQRFVTVGSAQMVGALAVQGSGIGSTIYAVEYPSMKINVPTDGVNLATELGANGTFRLGQRPSFASAARAVYAGFKWHRMLTQAEAVKMMREPWHFLQPAF